MFTFLVQSQKLNDAHDGAMNRGPLIILNSESSPLLSLSTRAGTPLGHTSRCLWMGTSGTPSGHK